MSGVVRIRVIGRPGCGQRTVARVLRTAGFPVVEVAERADLDIYVVAETLKPEDRRALVESPLPVVAVLNKADLTGFGGAGPVAAAAERCRLLAVHLGGPIYPLAGLVALAAVDDTVLDAEMLDALRTLGTDPADLGSTDRFADGPHRLPGPLRQRLLTHLDLFGIAHAVSAIRVGADRDGVRAALRRASALDGLLAGIDAAAAPVRYERLAASSADAAARMAAAIEVVKAAGMMVDDGSTAEAHLRRAIVWQRYARGPVSGLHGRCAADITRGSLRLWERAGGVPEPLP